MEKISGNGSYVYSRYNIYYPDFPMEGYELIFNTLEGNMFIGKQKHRGEGNRLEYCDDSGRLEVLLSDRLVVSENANEEERLISYFRELSADNSYVCFGIKLCRETGEEMTLETASQLVQWICGYIKRERPTDIYVRLYGMDRQKLSMITDYIILQLDAFCTDSKIGFSFGISVNTLYEPSQDKLDMFINRSLNRIEYVVSRSELVKDPDDYIEKLTATVLRLGRKIPSVSLVLEPEAEIYELQEKLLCSVSKSRARNIMVEIVSLCTKASAGSKLNSEERDKREQATLNLMEFITTMGLTMSMRFRSERVCSATIRSRFICDCNGDLYRCMYTCNMGDDRYKIGHVSSEEISDDSTASYQKKWERCAACSVAPICGGGCIYDETLEESGCEKAFLEELLNKSAILSMDRQQIVRGMVAEEILGSGNEKNLLTYEVMSDTV